MVRFFSVLLFFFQFSVLHSQVVSNILVSQEQNNIVVSYDLLVSTSCSISLQVSQDGGASWSSSLKSVKGDVGEKIVSGSHTITWFVLEEYNELRGDNIKFKVSASSGFTVKIGSQEGEEEEGPPEKGPPVEQVVEKIFTEAEVMPDFSGKDGFQAYLKKNVRYPFAEKDQGKQGTVYISFVVEKDGTIANVKAAKEVAGAPGFTKEAIRVISLMPKWTPGMMNGHPVRIEITQPVKFTLQ